MKKDLTQVSDLEPGDVEHLLDLAFSFKEKHHHQVRRETLLDGRVVAMIFEKPSLRTKVAFEVATTYLGGTAVYLSSEQILASGGHEQGRESIPDIGRNLERFADLILARVYRHDVIRQLASTVHKPVINALCDQHHPTQALADIMAIRWHKPKAKKLRIAFIGDGNNVATSLMQIAALMGYEFAIASPKGYEIPQAPCAIAESFAKRSGCNLHYSASPEEAVQGADVVYTDTFVSMGQEREKALRRTAFEGFSVTAELLRRAKKDAIFMHCLPAHRGEEVTDEVMDSPQSVVFDQAECRLHIAKALLYTMLR